MWWYCKINKSYVSLPVFNISIWQTHALFMIMAWLSELAGSFICLFSVVTCNVVSCQFDCCESENEKLKSSVEDYLLEEKCPDFFMLTGTLRFSNTVMLLWNRNFHTGFTNQLLWLLIVLFPRSACDSHHLCHTSNRSMVPLCFINAL